MSDQPEHKTCLACQTVFHRRPAPLDSSFRWMRRKYCSAECARSMVGRPHPAPPRAGGETEGER